MNKIKKNDEVIVLTGRDAGLRGKVEKVLAKQGMVVVGGINMYKKHRKDGSGSGIIDITKPLGVNKVALVCPKCSKTTRVGIKILANGEKNRFCKHCGESI